MSSGDSLPDLVRIAWRARSYILAGACAGFALALVLLLILTPVYEARMIIAPLDQSEERSLTVIDNNVSAARTSVSNQIPHDYTKFQQTFREASAAKILAKYDGILAGVNRDRLLRFGASPDIATPAQLSEYIRKKVRLDNIGATASQTIAYRHPDPKFAEKMLGHLHKIADEMIRNEARQRTEGRIAYLQKTMNESYNPEHRKILTDLLLQEERQKMFISMDHPFSAEIIEPPSSLAKKVWPCGSILFSLCLLAGAFLGFLAFSVKNQE